jgi:hypothetical protein
LRDGYEVDFLTNLPPSHVAPNPPPNSLCDQIKAGDPIACSPCAPDGWLVLATLTFKQAAAGAGSAAPVMQKPSYEKRRYLVSAALMQAQLLQCCCKTESLAADPLAPAPVAVAPPGTEAPAAPAPAPMPD